MTHYLIVHPEDHDLTQAFINNHTLYDNTPDFYGSGIVQWTQTPKAGAEPNRLTRRMCISSSLFSELCKRGVFGAMYTEGILGM